MGDPIIGRAIESGAPDAGTFRQTIRHLTLSLIGDEENWGLAEPHSCLATLTSNTSSGVGTVPDDGIPDSPGEDGPVEHASVIPCTEAPWSTLVEWPDRSILLLGHVSFAANATASVGSENGIDDAKPLARFRIDVILAMPTTAKLDWSVMLAPQPPLLQRANSGCYSELARRSPDYRAAVDDCHVTAATFLYMAANPHDAETPDDIGGFYIHSALASMFQGVALYSIGEQQRGHLEFDEGRSLLTNIATIPGCPRCQRLAQLLLALGWPPPRRLPTASDCRRLSGGERTRAFCAAL